LNSHWSYWFSDPPHGNFHQGLFPPRVEPLSLGESKAEEQHTFLTDTVLVIRRHTCAINLFLPYLKNLTNFGSLRRPGLPTRLDGSPDRIRQTELNRPLWFFRTLLLRKFEYYSGIRSVPERSLSCEYLMWRSESRC